MKRLTILIAIILTLACTLYASPLELSLGGVFGLSIPRAETVWDETYYSSAPVLGAEFIASYYPLDWLSLSLGVRYTAKGFFYTHAYQNVMSDAVLILDSSFEIPILVRFSMIRERLRWSIALGGYVGFRFVRNATGFMDNPSTGEYGDMSRGDLLWFQPIALTDEDSLFQGGATLEGAVDMLQPNGDAIRYSLRYDISLTSLYRMDYEDTMEHHYTDAITFGIAYIWGLGGEK